MSARTPEGKVKDEVRKIFQNINDKWPGRLWYCMPMGQMYGKRGVPDFLVCLNGKFVAIETKAKGGKLSAMQKFELRKIAEANGYNLVVYPYNLGLLSRMLHELAEFGWTGVEDTINKYGNEAIW